MIWTPAGKHPDKDMFCIVAIKRANGTIFVDEAYYTIGLQRFPGDRLFVGFMRSGVITWMPKPESYIRNKRRWVLVTERYPKKKELCIVSTYNQYGSSKVTLSVFDVSREMFFGQPDAIAWMPIPKVKVS